MTLFCWKGSDVLDLGCSLDSQARFLFDDMNCKTFAEWATDKVQFVNLSEGSAVWLPYGWFPGCITRSGGSGHSTLLVVPYVTKSLATRSPKWPEVASHLACQIQDMINDGEKAWVAHGEAAMEWLISCSAPVNPQQACLQDGAAPGQSACPAVASGTVPGDVASSASPAAVAGTVDDQVDDAQKSDEDVE